MVREIAEVMVQSRERGMLLQWLARQGQAKDTIRERDARGNGRKMKMGEDGFRWRGMPSVSASLHLSMTVTLTRRASYWLPPTLPHS